MVHDIDEQSERMLKAVHRILEGFDQDTVNKVCRVIRNRCDELKEIYEEKFSALNR